jgi:hypothetical protein
VVAKTRQLWDRINRLFLTQNRRPSEEWCEQNFARANGFTPMGEFDDRDVFVCGWPKSGSTWCQRLFSGVVWGLDTSELTDQLAQSLQPDVQYKRFYYRFRTPTIFKSHLLPQVNYRKVIFLVRDGRDALVSYWMMMRQAHPDLSLEDVFSMEDELSPCSWEKYARCWLGNPYGAAVMTIRYEDLLGEPLRELSRVSDFLGVARSGEELSDIIRGADIEKMRRIAQRHGWDNSANPMNNTFLGQGRAGRYRSEMPAELQERFVLRASDMLDQFGYL